MTKSSSSNKALFLAVLMAVSVPSGALAWNHENDPGEVLTVNVNMGRNDSGDGNGDGEDDGGCTGFSTMALSATTLTSRPERVDPGVANPTLDDRISVLSSTREFGIALSRLSTFTYGQQIVERVFTRSQVVTTSWMINTAWLDEAPDPETYLDRRYVAEELTQLDLGQWQGTPLTISAETPSVAMVDRRTYITSPFTVSFDATNCESDDLAEAEVLVERSNLEAFVPSNEVPWSSVELGELELGGLLQLAADGEFRGYSYLQDIEFEDEGTIDVGTIGRLPEELYDDDFDSEEAGTFMLRGVTQLFGELSQNAQLRTRYGFWLEVYPMGDR
jgi:hypothetical protein